VTHLDDPRTSHGTRRSARIKLTDVAAAAGVHYSTASRVLSPGDNGRISTDVAERVRTVARELGYRSNAVAAGLRTQSSRTMGLIVHDMGDPVYPPILNGIEQALSPQGYSVLVGNTGYDIVVEMDIFDRMAARMVDGIFLATTRLDDPLVDRCRQLGIPLISVLRQTRAGDVTAVINDCLGGMQAMAQQVLAAGHRDIAVILAPQYLSTAQERWTGIREVLQAQGITLPGHRIAHVKRMTAQEGERTAAELLSAGSKRPKVIMCVNDLVAVGALRACRTAGLRVPVDISLTGYNDIPLVDMINPPLTTVHIRLNDIGRAAGDEMLAQVKDPDAPAKIVRIASELIMRASLTTSSGGDASSP